MAIRKIECIVALSAPPTWYLLYLLYHLRSATTQLENYQIIQRIQGMMLYVLWCDVEHNACSFSSNFQTN